MLATLGYDGTTYLRKFLVGLMALLIGDGIWLGIISRRLGTYAGAIDKNVSGTVAALGILCYAAISAAFAALITPASAQDAAIVGALVGFLVFSAFNITTVVINAKWTPSIALTDTVYGTCAWTAMLLAIYAATRSSS
jgi:uncharacterized membrane protein